MQDKLMAADSGAKLPGILVGPMLRDVCAEHVVLWLLSSVEASYDVELWAGDQRVLHSTFAATGEHCVRVGARAWIYCLVVKGSAPLPTGVRLGFDIHWVPSGQAERHGWSASEREALCYAGASRPEFVIQERLHEVLHGSCRKPHHDGEDGLCTLDELLQQARNDRSLAADQLPALLLMSGDQVYVDDVAGPMLHAVHQVIDTLGLYQETLQGAVIQHSSELESHPFGFYQRDQLLPDIHNNSTLRERFFGGARKPIFTTQNADNHLISLSEVLALYFLVWSPVLWRGLSLALPARLQTQAERYQRELAVIERFVAGLGKVRRALANIPVYMIFDDHDVTDDWNLSRSWEEVAYQHPFSKRIIGNALIGYALCQAWGNRVDSLPPEVLASCRDTLQADGQSAEQRDQLITELLAFEGWSYCLDTQPKVVVLDTRTRRWRAESKADRPSGLMDWEALSETQQILIHEPAVILVSAAPIFGVKLIEVIQRLFSAAGQSLMVDAENWMAHPGSAHVILNIFRHKRTPHYFTILSGDVHYSFVYDVRLRQLGNSPHIWQITSSGILNRFPQRLLRVFDRLNRWLFASRSPLNWFTRRRHMRVRPRRPRGLEHSYPNQRLVNGCGIGRVVFDERGAPCEIEQVLAGRRRVRFEPGEDGDWIQ